MRKVILAMQTSLDGFIEGPNGAMDWVMEDDAESWNEAFEMLDSVDTCILGRVMYPDYARYWLAVLANPTGPMPLSGKPATEGDVRYARWADKIPHILVSRTVDRVEWKNTRIVRDAAEIGKLKAQPGKAMYVVGGATLASSLLDLGLIDEIRVTVTPLALGAGKSLFKDLKQRHVFRLMRNKALKSGRVSLTYAVTASG